MVRSQCERYLESLLRKPGEPDKPLNLDRTTFAEENPEVMTQVRMSMKGEIMSEEQLYDAMKSVLEPVYEARRQQRELFEAALLRTVCKKYTAITGKNAVDLTHGVPEDFREVYDSVYNAVFTEVFLRSPEEYWRMAVIQLDSDWGKI